MDDQVHATDACLLDAQSKHAGSRTVFSFGRVWEEGSFSNDTRNDEVEVPVIPQCLASTHTALGPRSHRVLHPE